MRLDAKLHKPRGLNAGIKRLKSVNVSLGGVTVTSEGYTPPTYEGATIVTPTKASQTLNTDGYFVKDDITIHPIPDEYIVPEGTKNIVTNGTHDVKQYESAKVNVPIPEGYIKPQGTKQITQNGSHDVGAYKTAAVNVPIPDGYIKPSGTKQITSNGEHDVNSYQKVNVDVPNEIPEGYYDASGIDTEPSKVLSGEEFINESGKQVGSMPNKGAVNATIQGLVSGMSTPQPYTIPEGYHNGQGKVQISSDVKTLHDNIATAIRQKGQAVSANYDPKAFPTLIGDIQTSEDLDSVLTEQEELIAELQETLMGKAAGGGGATPTQEKTVNITTNGTHTVSPDAGYALSKVTANVNVPLPEAEYREVTPTKDFQHITPSAGKIIGAVGVNPIPDEYIVPDWEYKQVTPTKEFQHVVPSEGKVLDAVGVDPIPDEYIIPQGEKEITENGQYDVSSFASVNVNVAGGGGEPDPRDQYQRVEYIESAEDETYPYIVTDFCADNDSGVEVIASFPILQDRIPMGSREDSGSTRFYCCYPLSSTGSYYGFNSGSTLSGSFAVNTKYICQTNFLCSRMAGIFTPNGDRKSSGIITSTLTTQSGPVSIFGYRYCSTGNMASKREYKFYGARLSQLFEVVREYIPCYRKSDGVVGVYEKFTGQFLTPETGAFAKGADIDW